MRNLHWLGIAIPLNYCRGYSASNGAISRYNTQRRQKPNFPKMYFLQADARALLLYDEQLRALGTMNSQNRDLLNRFFSADPSKRIMYDRNHMIKIKN